MFDKKLLESSELYDKRYRNFSTLIIVPMTVLLLFVLLFTLFAKTQLTVTTVGDIQPVEIISQIQSTSSNMIVENNLVEGKKVRNNELLIKYSGESDDTQLDVFVEQLEQLNSQKEQLTILQSSITDGVNHFQQPDSFGYYQMFQSYNAQVGTVTTGVNQSNQAVADQNNSVLNQREAISRQINSFRQQIADYQEVGNAISGRGRVRQNNPYISQYLNYQNQIRSQPSERATLQNQSMANVRSAIDQLQNQEQSLSTQLAGLTRSNSYDNSLSSQLLTLKAQTLQEAAQTMTHLITSISELNAKISLQKQANQNNTIFSDSAGILHLENDVLGMKNIAIGTLIAQIYPDLRENTQVYISTYVPSTEISGIKVGQKARFTIQQNLPQPKILSGTIKHIDSAPTTQNGANYYNVQIETTLSKSDLSGIRYGLQGKVVVVIGEKTYFNYYKDKIMGNQ